MREAASNFFAGLPRMPDQASTFDGDLYRPAPADWWLAASDVEDSTGAIGRGQYRAVNFVAAAVIAALKTLCRPDPVPFLFGGDGAVVLVPPERAGDARRELARVRGFAQREYGLVLRVGLVPVSALRDLGSDVLVGRYEPTPGNNFGVFLGGGVGVLEEALKGRGSPALAALAAVPPELDDAEPPNLDGLSCRWDELRSARGKMVSLIVNGAADPASVHAEIMRIAQAGGDARAVRLDNLSPRWPPKGLMIEARARRGRWPAILMAGRVLVESLFVALVLWRGKPLGSFDPQDYRREITTNTDFSKRDDVVSLVLDCDESAIAAIRGALDIRVARGELRYGMHLSDTALMTCIVTSLGEHEHAHFVDGANGGYTQAALGLKAGPAPAALRRG